MRKLRIIVLVHEDLVPPETIEGFSEEEYFAIKTEYDVVTTLREMGHEVHPMGLRSDLGVIRRAIATWRPHIAFNLLEEFHDIALYDQHVVSYLELLRQPYTGCNPRGLMLARDKAISKKILAYHRIRVPQFAVFPLGRTVKRPARLQFPLFVKSATEDASQGISHASIVNDDDQLRERIGFIHVQIGTDALAEQYIEGRELYVGVVGNLRLQTFPVWELLFTKAPKSTPRIATAKVKWDVNYQKKAGIRTSAAKNLPEGAEEHVIRLSKRIYRLLELTGYARVDFRMTPEGEVYVLEANPNPQLSYGEDFAESAEKMGMSYEMLLQRILNLGLRYRAAWAHA